MLKYMRIGVTKLATMSVSVAAVMLIVAECLVFASVPAACSGMPGQRSVTVVRSNDDDEKIVAAVIEVLRSGDVYVLQEKLGVKVKLDVEQAAITIQGVARRSPKLASRAAPFLIHSLAKNDRRAKIEIIRALGYLGPSAAAAIPHLTALLKVNDDDVSQFYAIHAAASLAQIAPAESTEMVTTALTGRLNDSRPWVRWITADALGESKIKSKRVLTALNKALDDEHVSVRVMAAKSLLRLGTVPDDKLVNVVAEALRGRSGGSAFIKPPYLSELRPTSLGVAMGCVIQVHDKLGHVPESLKDGLLSNLFSNALEIPVFALIAIERVELNDQATISALQEFVRRQPESRLRQEAQRLLAKVSK